MNKEFENAIKNGNVAIVKEMLKEPLVNPGANDNKALTTAVSLGNIELVMVLLGDPRVDPSAQQNWTLRIASMFGFVDILKKLLRDPRVDPSDNNNEAIMFAFQANQPEVANVLLQDPRVDPSVITSNHSKFTMALRSMSPPRDVVDVFKRVAVGDKVELARHVKQLLDDGVNPQSVFDEIKKQGIPSTLKFSFIDKYGQYNGSDEKIENVVKQIIEYVVTINTPPTRVIRRKMNDTMGF